MRLSSRRAHPACRADAHLRRVAGRRWRGHFAGPGGIRLHAEFLCRRVQHHRTVRVASSNRDDAGKLHPLPRAVEIHHVLRDLGTLGIRGLQPNVGGGGSGFGGRSRCRRRHCLRRCGLGRRRLDRRLWLRLLTGGQRGGENGGCGNDEQWSEHDGPREQSTPLMSLTRQSSPNGIIQNERNTSAVATFKSAQGCSWADRPTSIAANPGTGAPRGRIRARVRHRFCNISASSASSRSYPSRHARFHTEEPRMSIAVLHRLVNGRRRDRRLAVPFVELQGLYRFGVRIGIEDERSDNPLGRCRSPGTRR